MSTQLLTLLILSLSHRIAGSQGNWEFILREPQQKKLSLLAIPASNLCPPRIDATNLVEGYNGILINQQILKKIEFNQEDSAIFSTEQGQTVFLQTSDSPEQALLDCSKVGSLQGLSSENLPYIMAVLQNVVKSNRAKKIMLQVKCAQEKPSTNDNKNINVAGACTGATSLLIFEGDDKLYVPEQAARISTVLCSKLTTPLGEELTQFKEAVVKQTLFLETTISKIKTDLHGIIEKYSPSARLVFSTNGTAVLAIPPSPQSSPCLETSIKLCSPPRNHSFPSVITIANLKRSSEMLRSRLNESFSFTESLLEVFASIQASENVLPPLVVAHEIKSYTDLFKFVPLTSPIKVLIVALISTIVGTVIVSVLTFLICICLLKKGAQEWRRRGEGGTTSMNLQILNQQSGAGDLPSAPLLRVLTNQDC